MPRVPERIKVSPINQEAGLVLEMALGQVWPFGPVGTLAPLPAPLGVSDAAWGMRLRRGLAWLDNRYADPENPRQRFSLGVRFWTLGDGILYVAREGYPGTAQWAVAEDLGHVPAKQATTADSGLEKGLEALFEHVGATRRS